MRKRNQEQYQIQSSHPNHNQNGIVYISGRGLQTSEVYSSNKPEKQISKYSSSHQDNQRATQKNTLFQRGVEAEKILYDTKGKIPSNQYGIKKDENNERNELSSFISGVNESNMKGYGNTRNENFQKSKKVVSPEIKNEKREHIRERKKRSSNSNFNINKSCMSESKPINKFRLPKCPLKKINSHSVEIKRKTIIRGGKYKNIQITHIISASKDNIGKYKFHIIENLSRVELDKKPLDLKLIKLHIKKDINAKTSYSSSCNGRNIAPLSSREKILKTTIYQHAAKIGMTNLDPNLINPTFYQSGLLKLPKKKTLKKPPVTEIIDTFRSQKDFSSYRNDNKSTNKYDCNNSFNKTYYNLDSQIMNRALSSNKDIYKNNKEKNSIDIKKNAIENRNNINFVDKFNNLSNYNKIPDNNKDNKSIAYKNNRNNNIITVNKNRDNQDKIKSQHYIIPSNNNKKYNNSHNYNTENINNLKKIEVNQNLDPDIKLSNYRETKKYNKNNFNEQNEIKSTSANNFYQPTGFKKDIHQITTQKPEIKSNYNNFINNKITPEGINTNYNTKQPDLNKKTASNKYKISIDTNNINNNQKAHHKNIRTINQNTDIIRDYNASNINNNNKIFSPKKNIYSFDNTNNISNSRYNEESRINTKINADKEKEQNSNLSKKENAKTNLNKNNCKNIPKISINKTNKYQSPSEIKSSNTRYNTKQNINNIKSPSKLNINTQYNTNRNFNDKESTLKMRYNINQNLNNKDSSININLKYNTNLNSNNKESSLISNNNSRYNNNQNSNKRIFSPKVNINNNSNQKPNNKESSSIANIDTKYNNNKSFSPKANLNNKINKNKMSTQKPDLTLDINNHNSTQKPYSNNIGYINKPKGRNAPDTSMNTQSKTYNHKNFILPAPKNEAKKAINYVSPPSKIEDKQSNNDTISNNKMQYQYSDNSNKKDLSKLNNNINISQKNYREIKPDKYTRTNIYSPDRSRQIDYKEAKYNEIYKSQKLEKDENPSRISNTRVETNYQINNYPSDRSKPQDNKETYIAPNQTRNSLNKPEINNKANISVSNRGRPSDNKESKYNQSNKSLKPNKEVIPTKSSYIKPETNYRTNINISNKNKLHDNIIHSNMENKPLEKTKNSQVNYPEKINNNKKEHNYNNINSQDINLKYKPDNQEKMKNLYKIDNIKNQDLKGINSIIISEKDITNKDKNRDNSKEIDENKEIPLSAINASLKNEENINLDENEEPIYNITAFNNDDELIDVINGIEEDKSNKKKKLNDDKLNFMINGMLDDILRNKEIEKEDNENEEKEKIKNAVNVIKRLNKDDQTKTINALRNKVKGDEKKKEIVKKLQNEVKKYNNTKNIINYILEKKEKEEGIRKKEKNENKEKINEEKIENITLTLLGDLLKGESDLKNGNNYNYNVQSNDKGNKEKDIIIFEEKAIIDKATEKLNNLENKEQIQVVKRLRGRMKQPKEKDKLDKVLTSLNNINKMKQFEQKIKKKPFDNKVDKRNEDNVVKKQKLSKEELKEITNEFSKDLYKVQEEDQFKKGEEIDRDKDKEEKLKIVAKTIIGLNNEDKDLSLQKLKNDANDDEKKEQFNKLNNLINNTNNLKSYINKLIKEKISEDKNKEKNKAENQNILDNNDFNELNKILIDELFQIEQPNENKAKTNEHNLNKIDEEKMNMAIDILNDLNSSQQKQILENLKLKAEDNKNCNKYKYLIQKLKESQKIKNIINDLSNSKNNNVMKNEEMNDVLEEKNKKDRGNEKELKDEEFSNLAQNILNFLFVKDEYSLTNKIDKYLNKKEKEDNINKVADIINNLNNKDKESMLKLLNENADNKEKSEILKLLISKLKEKNPNSNINLKIQEEIIMGNKLNDDIIKEYNNNMKKEKKELNDIQIGELTNKFLDDLFKESKNIEEDEKEMEKKIHKVANVIKDLEQKDQAKILSLLKENVNDKEKILQIEKLNNLVNNMNDIKLYLKGIKNKNINNEKNKENKELEKEELNEITQKLINNLFNEEEKGEDNKDLLETTPISLDQKLNNMAVILNNLNENDKNKILNALEENAKNDKNQKILFKLRNMIKKVNQVKILADSMNYKKDEQNHKVKKKLSEEEINEIAYSFSSNLYHKEKEPSSSLENLIMNENKENQIKEMAESIKNLDKEAQDKALQIINNNAINNDQKEQANKLSNLIKNLNNMKSYFGKMIKNQLEKEKEKKINEKLLEKNNDNISKITNTFWNDLNRINQDKENNINYFANILKELNSQEQNRVLKILKNKTQKENKNINEIKELESKINDLNNMKNEIELYKNSINKMIIPLENEEKKFENEEMTDISPNKRNQEIVIQELEPIKLKQLANDFCIELNKEDNIPIQDEIIKLRGRLDKKEEDDIKINNIANIVVKLKEDDQKKVVEDLERKVKKDNLPKLIKKIEQMNKIKNISKIIKERKDKKAQELKLEEDNIKSLYEKNNKGNLPEKELDNIANRFIGNIFKENNEIKEIELNIKNDLLNDIVRERKIREAAQILNNLNNNDKKIVFEKMHKYVEGDNNPKNKKYLNKLEKIVKNFDKMKSYAQKIKAKLNKNKLIIKNKDIKVCRSDEQIQKFIRILFDDENNNINNDENIEKIAVEFTNLNKENQDKIMNKLKEEANTSNRKNIMNILLKKIEYINNINNLSNKIKEKQALKKAEEEIKNEEQYGIIIGDNKEDLKNIKEQNNKNINQEIIIQKPKEMNKNDLNQLTEYFVSDLYQDNRNKIEDENGKKIRDNSIEKYKKTKKIEKKMDDIADTINNLDDNDKQIVLISIKEKAKNNQDINKYNKLIHLIGKKQNKLEKEKRILKESLIKELDEQKKLQDYQCANLNYISQDGLNVYNGEIKENNIEEKAIDEDNKNLEIDN